MREPLFDCPFKDGAATDGGAKPPDVAQRPGPLRKRELLVELCGERRRRQMAETRMRANLVVVATPTRTINALNVTIDSLKAQIAGVGDAREEFRRGDYRAKNARVAALSALSGDADFSFTQFPEGLGSLKAKRIYNTTYDSLGLEVLMRDHLFESNISALQREYDVAWHKRADLKEELEKQEAYSNLAIERIKLARDLFKEKVAKAQQEDSPLNYERRLAILRRRFETDYLTSCCP